jgi:hypothetical protein
MEEQQLPLACSPRLECYMSKPHSSANNGKLYASRAMTVKVSFL